MNDRIVIEIPDKFEFSNNDQMCEEEKVSIAFINDKIDEEEYQRRLLEALEN